MAEEESGEDSSEYYDEEEESEYDSESSGSEEAQNDRHRNDPLRASQVVLDDEGHAHVLPVDAENDA